MSAKSTSSSARLNDVDLGELNKDALGDKRSDTERKKSLEVKKVSPVRKFFSSIRVIVFLVLLVFAFIFSTVVGVTTIVSTRKVYEKMDVLDLKERVQNGVQGLLTGMISAVSRASMLYSDFAYYPYFNSETLANFSLTEEYMASVIYHGEKVVTESSGLNDYDFLPFHLIMAWDQDWNERLAYYRPCRDVNNRTMCDLPDPEETFADIEHGDMTLIHKDKIPKVFRTLNETKPHCSSNGVFNCSGIMNIPSEEGGPMLFVLFNIGDYSSLISSLGLTYPFDHWTFLVASNAMLFNHIEANRTGMCTSVYSSTEKNLPDYMINQFKTKKEKKLTLNPIDFRIDSETYSNVINIDTGAVTLEQDYYADKKKIYENMKSDRSICDNYYDHGDEDYVSMATASLVYKTFNFEKGQNDDETVAFRFEYHAPLTKEHMSYATTLVAILCVVFVVLVLLVYVYFNFTFLIPLDRVRKMRAELIKNTLSGLEDDGVIAKDLFGDMIDDEALIEANGDDISVMLTLQDRLYALYSNIIKSRAEEVDRARAISRSELCALRIMNLFMRRDDESLRAILPGLLNPTEVSRRYRRTNASTNSHETEFINAKRAFRSLKAVLNNNIATQFFKAFCIQRGRSSVNSFFFLMDVSWLHQVEAGGRNEQDDFLSAMFSDSIAPSPALSPRSPFMPFNRAEEMNHSADLLVGGPSEDPLAQTDPNRPHRSHFAKKDSSRSNSICSEACDPPIANAKTASLPPAKKTSSNSGDEDGKKFKMPFSAAPGVGSSPRLVPRFSSKISEGIAHFIHESYFGRKSLAQRDLRHAALLGCSQVPDYLTMRDQGNVQYSPMMFDNLVSAVTKKFTSEVLPQFLNSVSFQVMVYALMITGFFDEQAVEGDGAVKEEKVSEQKVSLQGDDLVKGLWTACVNQEHLKEEKNKKANKKEDDSSSSSDSDSDSDSDTDSEEDEEEEGDDKHDNSISKCSSTSLASDDGKKSSKDEAKEEKGAKPSEEKPKEESMKSPEEKPKEEKSAKPEQGKKDESSSESSSSSGSSTGSSSSSNSDGDNDKK